MVSRLILALITLSAFENSIVTCEEDSSCFEEFPSFPTLNFSELDFENEFESRFCPNDSELLFSKNSTDFLSLFGSVDDFFNEEHFNSFNITEIQFNFDDFSNSCYLNLSEVPVFNECSTKSGKNNYIQLASLNQRIQFKCYMHIL